MNRTITSLSLLVASLAIGGQAMAKTVDPLHITGVYACTGFDQHDGAFVGDLTFTLDESASNFAQSFGAYKFSLVTRNPSATYSGYAAAQGQSLAMYFANDSEQAPTDRGVGMALISRDQDASGHYKTTLHKSYYLPEYSSKKNPVVGGRGTEVCVKKADAK